MKPRRRQKTVIVAVTSLFVVGLAVFVFSRLMSPSPTPPELILPSDIQDVEVRAAIDQASRNVRNQPDSADAWGRLGIVLEAHLFEANANECFAQAARLDPDNVRWQYFRGMYALKYEPDKALPLLESAASARDASPDVRTAVRLRLAEALLERDRLDDAERLFRDELVNRPGDPRIAYGLGLIARSRGGQRNKQDAMQLFLTARASPSACKPATAYLAALAREAGDFSAAAQFDRECADMKSEPPGWPDPLVDLIMQAQVGTVARYHEADQLEKKHLYAEAAQIYMTVFEEQRTLRACLGAGLNLARLKDYARALPLLEEAVTIDPNSSQAQYTLALVLFAKAEGENARAQNSQQVRDGFRLAVEHARRATELKPDHAKAYQCWGLGLKLLGDPAAAVAPLRKGVACLPGDFDLQLSLGEALLESGQLDDAAKHLENARKLDAKDPRPQLAIDRLAPKKKS